MVKTTVIKSISFSEELLKEINEKRKENNQSLSGFVNKQLMEKFNIKNEKEV